MNIVHKVKIVHLVFIYRPFLEKGLDPLFVTIYTISIYPSVIKKKLFEVRPVPEAVRTYHVNITFSTYIPTVSRKGFGSAYCNNIIYDI